MATKLGHESYHGAIGRVPRWKETDFLLDEIEKNGNSMAYAKPISYDEFEHVIEAVRKEGRALETISAKWRTDWTVQMEAVKAYGRAMRYCTEEFKADKAAALAAVQKNGCALEFVAPILRSDKEVVLAAVAEDGSAIRFCPSTLRADKDVAKLAVQKHSHAIQFIADELRGDKEVMLLAVQHCSRSLYDQCRMLRFHEPKHVLHLAPQELLEDRDFVLEAVKCNGLALEFASETLRGDSEVVRTAVVETGESLKFAMSKLRRDPELSRIARRLPVFRRADTGDDLQPFPASEFEHRLSQEADRSSWSRQPTTPPLGASASSSFLPSLDGGQSPSRSRLASPTHLKLRPEQPYLSFGKKSTSLEELQSPTSPASLCSGKQTQRTGRSPTDSASQVSPMSNAFGLTLLPAKRASELKASGLLKPADSQPIPNVWDVLMTEARRRVAKLMMQDQTFKEDTRNLREVTEDLVLTLDGAVLKPGDDRKIFDVMQASFRSGGNGIIEVELPPPVPAEDLTQKELTIEEMKRLAEVLKQESLEAHRAGDSKRSVASFRKCMAIDQQIKDYYQRLKDEENARRKAKAKAEQEAAEEAARKEMEEAVKKPKGANKKKKKWDL